MSLKEKTETFVANLRKMVQLKKNNIFTSGELRQLFVDIFPAQEERLELDFDQFLDQLNQLSYVLKKGNGVFQAVLWL